MPGQLYCIPQLEQKAERELKLAASTKRIYMRKMKCGEFKGVNTGIASGETERGVGGGALQKCCKG